MISVEYSAREVCPPALLLQQILRAHQVFLLHQAPSIEEFFARLPRQKFCGFLKRFWDGFIWRWNVRLHGNPAVDIFNGLKLAAGGELGIGVGEEEWGSGEREVLEGFVGRTEGLVDLVVARFGEAPPSDRTPVTSSLPGPNSRDINLDWQVSGDYPRPSDGIVFSGVGALTRSSVRSVSSWMELLYMFGQDAYGVRDNPSSVPRRKRRKILPPSSNSNYEATATAKQRRGSQAPSSPIHDRTVHNGPTKGPNIPPSIVVPDKTYLGANAQSASSKDKAATKDVNTGVDGSIAGASSGTDTLVKYLTLGVYGSTWGIPSGRPPIHTQESSLREGIPDKAANPMKGLDNAKISPESNRSHGYFLIGLQGELEEGIQSETTVSDTEPSTDAANASEGSESNYRVVMRTLHVERARRPGPRSELDSANDPETATEVYFDHLRVVVYIQKPFIFTFLFELHTDTLAIPSFYRSLHHQLGPLQRPLLASTSPRKVSERLWEAASPKSTASTASNQPICDLVYDPVRLTIHTTIPNIPEPGSAAPDEKSSSHHWTRVEALSVHSQILNTYISTRRNLSELERTCKTSRGWWVVWMRLPHAPLKPNSHADPNSFREAFLIRKASDYVAPAARKASTRFGREVSGSTTSGAWGPGKLAEGIGIDARQYIEGLLSLNR